LSGASSERRLIERPPSADGNPQLAQPGRSGRAGIFSGAGRKS
jgi:hypothetical protein